MKNDNVIKSGVEELQGLMNEWVLAANPNQTAYSDRILEEIVAKAKKLGQIHEGRFDSIDLAIDKMIII